MKAPTASRTPSPKSRKAVPTEEGGDGVKHDKGKLRFTLFPVEAITPILEVLEHGAAKYGVDNWRSLSDARERYLNALYRHLFDYQNGITHDKDSGLPTLAHVATNAIFLLALSMKGQLRR